MIRRLKSLLMGLTALLVSLLLGIAPVQANTALGAYQPDHQIVPGDQHAIHLTALGNFDYHAKIASECCNATNRTFDFANETDGFIDDIVDFNRTTDGGGTQLNGDLRSIVQSASYYDTPAEQGAAIFRSIVSNHTFVNGNKRTAVEAYRNFAARSGLPTNLSDNAMLDIATRVATGELSDVASIANALR